VLCCAWAALPLAEPLTAAARSAGKKEALPPIVLGGGSLFQPRVLSASAPSVSLAVSLPVAATFMASQALPADLVAPAGLVPLLAACRELGLKCAREVAAAGASEERAALAGFAQLSQAPDTLWLVGDLWDAKREAWRSSGKREPDAGECAQMLREVLAIAPLLGRASACTIPPFDGTTEGHALSREQGLARIAERCKKDVRGSPVMPTALPAGPQGSIHPVISPCRFARCCIRTTRSLPSRPCASVI
jgi:hypothetical protein